MAQTVKGLPAMWETLVRFLGREDPLEKEMAIHSSTLAWEIPWTEEPDRLQSMGSQRVGHNWVTSLHFMTGELTQIQFLPACILKSRTYVPFHSSRHPFIYLFSKYLLYAYYGIHRHCLNEEFQSKIWRNLYPVM